MLDELDALAAAALDQSIPSTADHDFPGTAHGAYDRI